MTRDEAVAEIQQGLGFRTDLSSQIVTKLQHMQKYLEQQATLPDFLLTEVASIATTSGEERVAPPSNFLRQYEEDALWYYDGAASDPEDAWTLLTKEDLQTLRKNATLAGSGAPQAYAFDGTYFRIFPTPDDAYTLKMIYYKQADALSMGSSENEWLQKFPYLLIGEAGLRIAKDIRDAGATAHFREIRDEAKAEFVRWITDREVMGRVLRMGGEI